MRKFKIFRVFGVTVSVQLSWIVIAAIVLWTLTASFFPANYPGLSRGQYGLMGGLATLAFFASITLHELCHAVVARHLGLPMKGITLWIFGGVAEMAGEPTSPGAEFAMAAAGPLATLVIVLATYELTRIGRNLGWGAVPLGVLGYIWRINLLLLGFNLIPAFPLDGGRLLRSWLWAFRGRLHWATRIASAIGAAFGMLLIVLGGFIFLFSANVGGLWYGLLGLFIFTAARSSYAQLEVREALYDVPLSRFIRTPVVSVPASTSVADFVAEFVEPYQYRVFPTVDAAGQVAGWVKMEAIKTVPRERRAATPVAAIMSPLDPDLAIAPDTAPYDAMRRMLAKGARHLIVTEKRHPVGIVGLNDITHFVSLKLELGETGRGRPPHRPFGFVAD